MLIICIITYLTLYSGIVWGTYLKFNNNGIDFNFKHKLYLILLPTLLFFIYLQASIRLIKKDKRMAASVLSSVFIKYPIIVGCFIEVSLESIAEYVVYNDSKLLKVENYVEGELTKVSFNIQEVVEYFEYSSLYKASYDFT